MKLIFVALIFVTMLFFAQNCSAQTIVVDKKPSQIFLQIIIHDTNGKLVAYLEPTVMYLFRPDLVDSYLVTKQHTTITKDGKSFEQFQYEEHGTFSTTHAMAQYQMTTDVGKNIIPILTFLHDGYDIVPGDTVSALWTVREPLG
jgi:hypothetical protein